MCTEVKLQTYMHLVNVVSFAIDCSCE